MSMYHLIFFIWVLLSSSFSVVIGSVSWCPHQIFHRENQQFEQKTDRFWEFKEETNTWVEVKLPFDLISCVNDNCTKVGSIRLKKSNNNDKENQEEEYDAASEKMQSSKDQKESSDDDDDDDEADDDDEEGFVLPLRKKISLTKMSETSIWITGQSGCIYERFWNGVQWVVAPHDLPLSEGHAASVFIVNHTILALSESGNLYQMQLNEISQPIWLEFVPTLFQTTDAEVESSRILIKSGVVSHDGERVYFCTMNGTLLELAEIEPTRWVNHGQPPGADVAAVADAGTIRPEVVYTISSIGNLYEYDSNSKPLWKKHIWKERTAKDASLEPLKGASLHGLIRDHSISLFLLTKGGDLVERRLNHRKWKWLVHGSPKNQHLSSIAQAQQDDSNDKFFSLFFTTFSGSVFEYRISKKAGDNQANQMGETWVNHMHPPHAKAARGIGGLQLQAGRIVFPLDDGRLAELHISGIGGENVGPTNSAGVRRKSTMKYVWSVLDAPETEGWNAEYCTEEHGPTNCIMGIKDEPNDLGTTRLATRRRKGSQQDYLIPSAASNGPANALDEYSFADNWIEKNFRLRVMQGGRSFFLITDGGLTFEYLYTESTWIWLRHDYPGAIKGAVGNYNGSLYVFDTYGSLLIRERSGNELAWINCTALKKGSQVTSGPPWDGMPGRALKVTPEDALFFVNRNGKLLQFTVALRKFKWKNCQNPPNTKVACIIDQELFRENIVFVVGTNGRLYQYNKVTELWHEHYQSQHLILSRLPGTATRPSSMSLTGSLFMLSEDGGLVEYHWNSMDGWNWVEHGAPHKGVRLVGSPGPSFEGNQLFLISSDGNVYLRYMDQTTWKWKNCGFPYMGNMEDQKQEEEEVGHKWKKNVCVDEDFSTNLEDSEHVDDISSNCDPKVASIRPIPFSEDSVIFELRDGRLGELRRVESTQWIWSRTIGTPTSLCMENYWTAIAS